MSNQLTIQFADEYILVGSDGAKDYQFALRLWTEVAKMCRENDCYKVLGVAQTTIPLKTSEAYDHYKIFEQADITSQFRIAWVELNPEAFGTTYFIETVL